VAGRNLELILDMSLPTVLVVDDEPLIRWSVTETLADSGYDVTQANDAQAALRVIAVPGTRTDAVLLDLWLPDSQDLSVLSAIRTISPETPVILMTARGTDDVFEEARARGAFMTLHKPFDMAALPPLVAAAVASSRVH
jgi:DNA-binding NtrC family response regulator